MGMINVKFRSHFHADLSQLGHYQKKTCVEMFAPFFVVRAVLKSAL